MKPLQLEKGGKLILKEIPIDLVCKKKVYKNNPTSGKCLLPKEFIGQEVYIVLPKKKGDKDE